MLGSDAQKVEKMKALLQSEQDEYVAWLQQAAAESPSIHQHYDHDVACEVEVSWPSPLLQGFGCTYVPVAGNDGCWVVHSAPGMRHGIRSCRACSQDSKGSVAVQYCLGQVQRCRTRAAICMAMHELLGDIPLAPTSSLPQARNSW